MFDSLKNFFVGIWEAAKGALLTFIDVCKNFFLSVWGIAVAIFTAVVSIFEFIGDATGQLSVYIDQMVIPNWTPDTTGLSTVLRTANTFFPINELFAMLAVYWTLAIIMMCYRAIKTWLPGG